MKSSIDILLLGLLKEENLSAYDLQKIIEERNIKYWVQVSRASIYKRMLALEKYGFVSSEIIKNGSMPEKTVYSITETGTHFFMDGMNELSKETLRFFIDFNIVLLNLGKVDTDLQVELVKNIEKEIVNFIEGIRKNAVKQVQVPFLGDAFVQQQLMLSETMVTWIKDFSDKMDGGIKN